MTFSPRFHSLSFLTAKKDEVSHSLLMPISETIEQDLKNIDDRTMDSLNYYETLFTYFEAVTVSMSQKSKMHWPKIFHVVENQM